MTFGQKAVGAKFNPSKDDKVDVVKSKFAEIIDLLQDHQGGETKEPYLTSSIKGEALRKTMDAQMWSVKQLTWKE